MEKQGRTTRTGRCLSSKNAIHLAVHPRIEIDTVDAKGIDHLDGPLRRQNE